MSTALPDAIEVIDLPDGFRYRLPRRDLGGFRYLGIFLVLFGLFFAGFAIFWGLGASGALGDGFHWIGLLFALFAVPFILAGLAVIGVGLAILAGRSEVEIAGGRLRAVERVGAFRWYWQRPVEKVRKLVVGSGVTTNDRPVTSGPLADLAAIKVECDGAGPLLLAVGYRKALVAALAGELARRCHLAAEATTEIAPRIEVTEEKCEGRATTFVERDQKPADSQVVLEEAPTGMTLTVPPVGIWQGSKGLFAFGIIWCLITAVASVIFLVAGLDGPIDFWAALIVIGVLGLFWVIGLAMLLGGINMGKRQAVLAIVGDRLLILQTGIFGSKRSEWARDQVADVRTGGSGMEVNEVPVIELQIIPREGKKVGLLAGRDDAELAWMATMLRRALRI